MKKIILLGAVALTISLASCRKQRTCECKTTETTVRTGFGAQTTVDNTSWKYTEEKQKKKQFKYTSGCYSTSEKYHNDGGSGPSAWSSETTVERSCELK